MSREIAVLGVIHEVQGADKWPWPRIDDTGFKLALKNLIRGKDFIFEEMGGLGPTTAERLATARLGAGHYLDVDPPKDQRLQYGIPEETSLSTPIDPVDSDESMTQPILRAHQKREELWIQRIQESASEKPLLICGEIHVLSVSFRLQAAGYTVDAFHYSVWQRILTFRGARVIT